MQSIYVKVPEDIVQNIVQQMYDDGYVYDSKNDSQFLSDRDPLIVKMSDGEYREVTAFAFTRDRGWLDRNPTGSSI